MDPTTMVANCFFKVTNDHYFANIVSSETSV